MFAFLTSATELDAHRIVLEEPGIKFSDKMAFACLYLSDEALHLTITRFWHLLLRKGDLQGLLLCGMDCWDSIVLLQQ